VISPNTAMAAAQAIRRGHQGPGHDDGDACEELASRIAREGDPEPGHTPKITISVKTEITGEWVTPEMVAYTARQLADSFMARLSDAVPTVAAPDSEGGQGPREAG
jgi:hypothetical protein